MRYILLLLLMLSLHVSGADKPKSDDEIDYIAMAALLFKDGNINRAAEALNSVDTSKKDIDLIRYYTLKGLVATKQGKLKEANGYFQESIKAGQEDKSIYLYMAQNYFKLKAYNKTIEALNKASELVAQKPKLIALKAESFWRLKESEAALVTLKEGLKLHRDYYDFYKQRFYYFVALGLYQSALEDANIYMQKGSLDEKSTIALIVALRKAKEIDRAITLAEMANLRYTKSAEITVLLAHLYLDKSMVESAANLFDEASIEDSKYTKEAAELYRRAKDYTLSLYKNSQMLDTKEKYKQRIAIYLEYGDYERVIATHAALERSGLIENEDMRYALAYAYYMVGDYTASEAQLKKLRRADLFAKALELRKSMQKCQNNHWECE